MSRELIDRDFELVHAELIYVQRCRNAVFLGTFGLIGALTSAGLAVLASWQNPDLPLPDYLVSQSEWFICAITIAYLIALFGIYCTHIKGRDINKLTGYLLFLTYLIRKTGTLLSPYQGWKHYELSLRDCKAFRVCRLCPKLGPQSIGLLTQSEQANNGSKIACRKLGIEAAYESMIRKPNSAKQNTVRYDVPTKEFSVEIESRGKRPRSKPVDAFMSFMLTSYISLYAFAAIGFQASLIPSNLRLNSHPIALVWIFLSIFGLVIGALLGKLTKGHHQSINLVSTKLTRPVSILATIISIAGIFISNFLFFLPWQHVLIQIAIAFSSLGMGYYFAYSVAKLIEIRSGKSAIHAFYHIWRQVADACQIDSSQGVQTHSDLLSERIRVKEEAEVEVSEKAEVEARKKGEAEIKEKIAKKKATKKKVAKKQTARRKTSSRN